MMPPRLPIETVRKIQTLRAIGCTYDQIEQELEIAELHVSRGAIHRHAQKWETLDESMKLLERPFHWHEMETYGLPWEAGSLLLRAWAFIKNSRWESAMMEDLALASEPKSPDLDQIRDLTNVERFRYSDSPTVREAKWYWRVHLALPDLEPIDLIPIGTAFAFREYESQFSGGAIQVADLEGLLAWRPWLTEELRENYYKAVERGVIPRVENHGVSWGSEASNFVQGLIYSGGWPDSYEPHKLPSDFNRYERKEDGRTD
jgi:hypothetical protein